MYLLQSSQLDKCVDCNKSRCAVLESQLKETNSAPAISAGHVGGQDGSGIEHSCGAYRGKLGPMRGLPQLEWALHVRYMMHANHACVHVHVHV